MDDFFYGKKRVNIESPQTKGDWLPVTNKMNEFSGIDKSFGLVKKYTIFFFPKILLSKKKGWIPYLYSLQECGNLFYFICHRVVCCQASRSTPFRGHTP